MNIISTLTHPVVLGVSSIMLGLFCFYLRYRYPVKNGILLGNTKIIMAGTGFLILGLQELYDFIKSMIAG
jgi:hypothetical protein